MLVHRLHGDPRSLKIRGAGQHGPTLRHGVDPALFIGGSAERRAVVVERPAIPGAVPRISLGRGGVGVGACTPPRGKVDVTARFRVNRGNALGSLGRFEEADDRSR